MATNLIYMTRIEPPFPGGPTSANVHPNEVENMQRAGWVVSDSPADEIFDALDAMESEPEAWTDSGLPKADRLAALLGRKVTAADRDKYWADYQLEQSDNGTHT